LELRRYRLYIALRLPSFLQGRAFNHVRECYSSI
jgi:hypothetical protein